MGNALVTVESKAYALVNSKAGKLQAALKENLGGETISPSDLDRAKVPTGGGTSWTIPGIEGDETTKEIEGVIVFTKIMRAYWPKAGMNDPPQCSSKDNLVGIGDPGGECAKCQFAQWGTKIGQDGSPTKGQACKKFRLLFIMRPKDSLPLIVSVPPASLKGISQYLLRLAGRGYGASGVVTRLSLGVEKNTAGVKYSKIIPSSIGALTEEHAQTFYDFGQSLKELFDSVDAADVVDADTEAA